MPGLPVGRSGLRSKLRICDSRITPFRSIERPAAAPGVGDVEHRGFRGRIAPLGAVVAACGTGLLGVGVAWNVVPPLRMDDERAGDRLVGDWMATDDDRTVARDRLDLEGLE